MSLLGKQVYANPTTPIWGQGGNVGPNPTFNSVTFIAQGPPFVSTGIETTELDSLGSAVSIVDVSGNLGPLAASSFYAEPPVGFGARVAYKNDRIDFENASAVAYSLATVNTTSNGWNLSNISTINGSNYPPGGGSYPTDASFNTVNVLQGGNISVGSSLNEWTSLRFFRDVSGTDGTYFAMAYTGAPNLSLCVRNLSNYSADQLRLGDLRAYGDGGDITGASSISLGTAGTATIGIRQVDSNGTPTADYITFAPSSNAMDLSNVTSINARPVPVTVTNFTQAYSSPPIASSPGTVMAAQTFTAPADGKLFIQAVGNFQSTITTGTSVAVKFDVNGTEISGSYIYASCGNLILDVAPSTMAQFSVTGGTVYDVSLIAISATSSGDWNGIAGQLYLSFTTA